MQCDARLTGPGAHLAFLEAARSPWPSLASLTIQHVRPAGATMFWLDRDADDALLSELRTDARGGTATTGRVDRRISDLLYG